MRLAVTNILWYSGTFWRPCIGLCLFATFLLAQIESYHSKIAVSLKRQAFMVPPQTSGVFRALRDPLLHNKPKNISRRVLSLNAQALYRNHGENLLSYTTQRIERTLSLKPIVLSIFSWQRVSYVRPPPRYYPLRAISSVARMTAHPQRLLSMFVCRLVAAARRS